MDNAQLEEMIAKSTKGLPKEMLREILDFIEFVRQKRLRYTDSITNELSDLNRSDTQHLQDEFKDYKELYPRDDE